METQDATKVDDKKRPEAIEAVPVRHPGRWVGAAVIALFAAMFIHGVRPTPTGTGR